MGQFRVKLQGNQDAASIAEAVVLKVIETNKIRDRCRAICGIPENRMESNRKKQGVGNEWKALGAIQEVNSADQIDQLNASRFEMQSRGRICLVGSGEISENEMPGMGEKSRKKKLTSNIGTMQNNRNRSFWETWRNRENAFSEIPDTESLIWGEDLLIQ